MKEPLTEIKKHGLLSGLIFMMFDRVADRLGEDETRRMLVLSMAAIDRMRSAMRLILRKMLIPMCKALKKGMGEREQLIWSRTEAKATGRRNNWRKGVEKRMEGV